jgi:hypothetical protein
MAAIYIVNGKPSMSANLMAARVKLSGKYRYEVLTKDESKCSIQFWELIEDWTADGKQIKKWVKPGPPEVYTVELAKKAGLTKNPVWTNHPMNMCFARAMSNGVKTYCPDLMNGVPLYTPDEMDPNMKMKVTADGDVIPDADYVIAAPKAEAGPPDPALAKGIAEIRILLAKAGASEKDFLTQLCKVDSAEKLTLVDQQKVIQMLQQRLAASPKGG